MKHKYLLVSFIFILFLLPLVNAAPPFQAGEFEDGITLRQPPTDVVKLGQSVTVNTHAFNTSSGLVLRNDTTSCIVHIFNASGYHTTNSPMDFDIEHNDFKLFIDAGNFSKPGVIGFILQCNTSTTGGFISGGVEVTPTGNPTSDIIIVTYSLLFFIVFAFLILNIFNIIQSIASLDLTLKDCAYALMGYLGVVFYYYFAQMYFASVFVLDLLNVFLWVGGFTNLILPLIGVFIVWLKNKEVK